MPNKSIWHPEYRRKTNLMYTLRDRKTISFLSVWTCASLAYKMKTYTPIQKLSTSHFDV